MKDNFEKIDAKELTEVVGGLQGKANVRFEGPWAKVKGLTSGYLALRSAPSHNVNNEIGRLYNGDSVQIIGPSVDVKHDFDKSTYTTYLWVYSPRLNMSGYANSRFLD